MNSNVWGVKLRFVGKLWKNLEKTGTDRQESGKKRNIFGKISAIGAMQTDDSLECKDIEFSGFFRPIHPALVDLKSLFEGWIGRKTT